MKPENKAKPIFGIVVYHILMCPCNDNMIDTIHLQLLLTFSCVRYHRGLINRYESRLYRP